jgi:hypothetical protein
MKKILVTLLLIFVTSCQLADNEKVQKPIDFFDVGDECPHVCWLGISPDETTADEAIRRISDSNQIDHDQTRIDNEHIFLDWIGDSGAFSFFASIDIKNGIVYRMTFIPPHREPFITIGELISLLGEPSLISISTTDGYDGIHALYTLYFQSTNTIVYVSDNLYPGPDSSNIITGLELNTQLDMTNPPSEWPVFQPWLGYGHLKDYLPTMESP